MLSVTVFNDDLYIMDTYSIYPNNFITFRSIEHVHNMFQMKVADRDRRAMSRSQKKSP